MFVGGAAKVEHGSKSPSIACQERLRVEAETGKDLRAIDPVRAYQLLSERPLLLFGTRGSRPAHSASHEVLEHSGSFVVRQLWAQVDVPGRPGNLDHQLRRALHESFRILGPTAALGQDAEH